jgi:hypothetical protein
MGSVAAGLTRVCSNGTPQYTQNFALGSFFRLQTEQIFPAIVPIIPQVDKESVKKSVDEDEVALFLWLCS